MDANRWAEAFAEKLLQLGTRAERDMLIAMGHEMWPDSRDQQPEAVATEQFAAWPPHDD